MPWLTNGFPFSHVSQGTQCHFPAFPFGSFHLQMAQRKIRDILAQVKQQHQKGQSGQLQARRK